MTMTEEIICVLRNGKKEVSKTELAIITGMSERACRGVIQQINRSTEFDVNVGWNQNGYFLVHPQDEKEIERIRARVKRDFERNRDYLEKLRYLEEVNVQQSLRF